MTSYVRTRHASRDLYVITTPRHLGDGMVYITIHFITARHDTRLKSQCVSHDTARLGVFFLLYLQLIVLNSYGEKLFLILICIEY